MNNQHTLISKAFWTFMTEAPEQSAVWKETISGLNKASALDPKTAELAYLAVLAALRLENGIPFHVQSAKKLGATREEVISAVLVGLPAAGHCVTEVLPAVVQAYDAE